jgi:UDP-glucose 4-epimerase
LISAHVLALDALRDRKQLVYNLGNGAGYSVREVIDTACRVTGFDIPVIEGPRRPGDAPRLVADSSRIRSELGWKPKFPDLERIIGSAWEWHRNHPRGYAS